MVEESYDQLLEKARNEKSLFIAKAGEYVPKMYAALRKEGLDPSDAKDRIEKDLVEVWELDTIRRHLPNEAKNKKKQVAALKSHAVRNPARIIQKTDGSQEIAISNEQDSNQLTIPIQEPQQVNEEKQKDEVRDRKELESTIYKLKERIRELEEPKEGDDVIDLGRQLLPVHYTVRQVPSFRVKLTVDHTKLREMVA